MPELEIRGGLHRDMWRLFGSEIAFGGIGLVALVAAVGSMLDGQIGLLMPVLGAGGLVLLAVSGLGVRTRIDDLRDDSVLLHLDATGVAVAHGPLGARWFARTPWDNVDAVVVREVPHVGRRSPGRVVQFQPKRPGLVEGDVAAVAGAARALGESPQVALLAWPVPPHSGLSPDPVLAHVRAHHADVRIEDRR
jgi:hypothetical protein